MRLTLIDEVTTDLDAERDGDRLLVGVDDFARATGWELKPEGLCREEICVPIRPNVRDGERIDLPAAAEALGRAFVVADDVAALAGDPMGAGQRASIDELSLPDLDGNTVHLSGFAGRKRLLVAWASW